MNTSIPFAFQDSRSGTAVINRVLGMVERISDEGMVWFRKGGIIHRTEKRKGVFVNVGVKLVEDESWDMPRLVECDWDTSEDEKPSELDIPENTEQASEQRLEAVREANVAGGREAVTEVLAGE